MLAPKVAKPPMPSAQTRRCALAPQRSAREEHSHDLREQALFFQRAIGNQATLRLLQQQASTLAGSAPNLRHEVASAFIDPRSGNRAAKRHKDEASDWAC